MPALLGCKGELILAFCGQLQQLSEGYYVVEPSLIDKLAITHFQSVAGTPQTLEDAGDRVKHSHLLASTTPLLS